MYAGGFLSMSRHFRYGSHPFVLKLDNIFIYIYMHTYHHEIEDELTNEPLHESFESLPFK